MKLGEGGIAANLDSMFDTQKTEFSAADIFDKAKELSKVRKCDESFEVIVKLNVDPTQGE